MQQRLRLTSIGRLYPMSPDAPHAFVEDAYVVIQGEVIQRYGTRLDAPPLEEGEFQVDLQGALVTPGLVDSHTHLIWAGSRQGEFVKRLQGQSYLDIAKAGGGIMSTVRQVRQTSLEDLIALARPRLRRLLSFGITTLEAKSGYALETASELRSLQALRALAEEGPLEIVPTFLGAHTVPVEHRGQRQSYVDLVCEEMIPAVAEARLAEGCDVFVEDGAFTLAEGRRILQAGKAYGLQPRLHADQLSAGGGAELAAEVGAASADHLEMISEAGIQAMSAAGVVACMLPGSTFCLRQTAHPPARKLLDAGVVLALATDLNPGTTCSENLLFMGTLACLTLGLTPEEALFAMTYGGARSLRREDRIGQIKPGYQADLAAFRVSDPALLFSHYAVSHTEAVWKKGRRIYP